MLQMLTLRLACVYQRNIFKTNKTKLNNVHYLASCYWLIWQGVALATSVKKMFALYLSFCKMPLPNNILPIRIANMSPLLKKVHGLSNSLTLNLKIESLYGF